MKEHREELEQRAAKLEGTRSGLSKWAAQIGMGAESG